MSEGQFVPKKVQLNELRVTFFPRALRITRNSFYSPHQSQKHNFTKYCTLEYDKKQSWNHEDLLRKTKQQRKSQFADQLSKKKYAYCIHKRTKQKGNFYQSNLAEPCKISGISIGQKLKIPRGNLIEDKNIQKSKNKRVYYSSKFCQLKGLDGSVTPWKRSKIENSQL